jgi:hypothetical protein
MRRRPFSRPRLTGADAKRRHVQKRAWERFALALHVRDIEAIEARLISGRGQWICDYTDMRTAYAVEWNSQILIVIFDIPLWCAVTLLPSKAWALRHPTCIRQAAE